MFFNQKINFWKISLPRRLCPRAIPFRRWHDFTSNEMKNQREIWVVRSLFITKIFSRRQIPWTENMFVFMQNINSNCRVICNWIEFLPTAKYRQRCTMAEMKEKKRFHLADRFDFRSQRRFISTCCYNFYRFCFGSRVSHISFGHRLAQVRFITSIYQIECVYLWPSRFRVCNFTVCSLSFSLVFLLLAGDQTRFVSSPFFVRSLFWQPIAIATQRKKTAHFEQWNLLIYRLSLFSFSHFCIRAIATKQTFLPSDLLKCKRSRPGKRCRRSIRRTNGATTVMCVSLCRCVCEYKPTQNAMKTCWHFQTLETSNLLLPWLASAHNTITQMNRAKRAQLLVDRPNERKSGRVIDWIAFSCF